MTISIWRYSHLILAVSSFLFLTLASITGVILAFEPIVNNVNAYQVDNFKNINLSQTLPQLRKKYPDISELSVNANHSVLIKASDIDGKNASFYVNPLDGKVLGVPSPKNEFFQWTTDLHRSLFIHETGRFFIGLTAFLLLLITISGTILIIQRQRGVKRFFTKIVKENFAQYYHVVLGRLSLIPIFVIALTGTYLSLVRFELIKSEKVSLQVDFDAIKSSPVQKPEDFTIFKNTKLSEVESIEFPFSEDVEDYYTFKLKDRELAVNQITGEILAEKQYPTAQLLTNLSLDLHTGRVNSLWAIILAIASCNILFFIYSGFAITFKRRAKGIKNKYSAEESKFVILVGSENGSTLQFASSVHEQLIQSGEKSFLAEMNQYQVYPKAEYLLVMTATYGLGDAPTNAQKFASLLAKYPQPNPIRFSVLGFGSHAYPDFCQFAFEVNQLLNQQNWAKPLVGIHTVADKLPDDFGLWAEAWTQQTNLSISLKIERPKVEELSTLKVLQHTKDTFSENTFMLRLAPQEKVKVTSGDLLAIYPANDHRERLYSIGLIDKEIQLSVKLHANGLGSNYLYNLNAEETISAKIVRNKAFHFPKKASSVMMICNGTGIAPFLGMISQNKKQIPSQLYCGFRTHTSLEIYQASLKAFQENQQLQGLNIALSREGTKQYVGDLVKRDAEQFAEVLQNKGVIMICGSLAMQKDVVEVLDNICQEKIGKSVSYFQSHGQILMDCY
ncbi:PepSY domain-containing protein [Arcicella lustrica]|uniref:NADPH--hemoprotein reductase n=1 Tax=Arcicella lustrica TaxID=2984196 RepID=A0ABU5SPH2_9BACT|nr:PepSY domain-containing protein [Arcicella sp. DC25W]MEA5429206.1 PepSY domain-containing protein [Arcicella sp. DC25W]